MASKHERHFAARHAHTPPTLTAHVPKHPEREKAGQERHKLDERRLRRQVAATARHAEADCSAPASSGGRRRGPRSHSAHGTWRRGQRAPCGRQRRPRRGEGRGVPSHCGEQAECERRRDPRHSMGPGNLERRRSCKHRAQEHKHERHAPPHLLHWTRRKNKSELDVAFPRVAQCWNR